MRVVIKRHNLVHHFQSRNQQVLRIHKSASVSENKVITKRESLRWQMNAFIMLEVKGKKFASVTIYGTAYLMGRKVVLLERTQGKQNKIKLLFRI
jgi:hypothetical protein